MIADDFYPGISIHRTLRRSPNSILALHQELLRANGFRTNKSNVAIALSASRAFYAFVSDHASSELEQYEVHSREKGRPIRGPVVIQFDLVIQILSQVLEYAKQHPKESLEVATYFTILEDYLERKLGPIVAGIWKKVSARKSNSTPNIEILRLIRIERRPEIAPKRKKRLRNTSRRKSKVKPHTQVDLRKCQTK